jgi:hypothetical protein
LDLIEQKRHNTIEPSLLTGKYETVPNDVRYQNNNTVSIENVNKQIHVNDKVCVEMNSIAVNEAQAFDTSGHDAFPDVATVFECDGKLWTVGDNMESIGDI